MEEDGPSIDVLMETWSRYRPAHLDLLSRLHRPKSLRDPVCEWSEMLVKQLLHGRFPVKPDQSIDPVRKDYDIMLDKDGTGTAPLNGESAQRIFRGRPRGRLGTFGSGNGRLRVFLIITVGLMRTVCGGWIKLCVGRASAADQSEPAHTSAFSGILSV